MVYEEFSTKLDGYEKEMKTKIVAQDEEVKEVKEVRLDEERRTAGAKRQQHLGAERRTAHRLGIQEELFLQSLRSRPSYRRFAPRTYRLLT